jgi:hypothetical protein
MLWQVTMVLPVDIAKPKPSGLALAAVLNLSMSGET